MAYSPESPENSVSYVEVAMIQAGAVYIQNRELPSPITGNGGPGIRD